MQFDDPQVEIIKVQTCFDPPWEFTGYSPEPERSDLERFYFEFSDGEIDEIGADCP